MNRLELINTLDIVSRGLSNNTLVPIFSHFCFTGETVFGWNDVIGVVGPCKIDKPFAVHGATLLGLLKNCSGNEVEITVSKNHLKVVSGNSDFKLPYKGEDEFLWKEPKIDGVSVLVEIRQFEQCLRTCSMDQSLAAFSRVSFVKDDRYLVAYSTDGDALTRSRSDEMTDYGGIDEDDFSVARSFCDVIAKSDKADSVDLKVNKEWVWVDIGAACVYGRNLGKPELDYEQEIRNTVGLNNYKFVPIPNGLDAALSRARVVADAETKPTKLVIVDGILWINTESNSIGSVEDNLQADHGDMDTSVYVSAEGIQKCMGGCNEMYVATNCTLWRGENVLRLVANRGE